MRRIVELPQYVAQLPDVQRELFARIFALDVVEGETVIPPTMREWVESYFGSVQSVQHQHIVKLLNLVTVEGALFNPLRAGRPLDSAPPEHVMEAIEATRGGPFCHAEDLTPEDVFGRIRGKHCLTASNVAKYEGHHGLVIFDEHNPLEITNERVHDYIDTALHWARRAHNVDACAKYFFLIWNCLWKGGASVVHGHMQVALGRGAHYARVEHWRRQSLLYRLAHGTNYFEDLCQAHEALGLAGHVGRTRALVSLTPVKERELLLVSPTTWVDDDDFKDAVSKVLDAYIHRLGVRSFNLALYQRPIDAVEEDWEGFPAMIRIVDRGEPQVRTADVGCMELYGSSVVWSDPYRVVEAMDLW